MSQEEIKELLKNDAVRILYNKIKNFSKKDVCNKCGKTDTVIPASCYSHYHCIKCDNVCNCVYVPKSNKSSALENFYKKYGLIDTIKFSPEELITANKIVEGMVYNGEDPNLLCITALFCYLEKKNNNDGIKYSLKAIDKGCVLAMHNLGYFYERIDNYELAIKYYKMAIDKNHAFSMRQLGVLYEEQKNDQLAIKYYQMAIDNGCVRALNNLALLHDNLGNMDDAIKYYKMAIENKSAFAMNNLAYYYSEKNNKDEAIKYYLMAIQHGSNAAYDNILRLMTKKELYVKLIKLLKSNFIDIIIDKLLVHKEIYILHNKINNFSKTGDCPICFEENILLISASCSFHFFCPDCYIQITKCSMCRMS